MCCRCDCVVYGVEGVGSVGFGVVGFVFVFGLVCVCVVVVVG